jgi:hypothetical protein
MQATFHPSRSAFSADVVDYMRLNGFVLVQHDSELDSLSFRKNDIGVMFWQDKIERRILSPDKTVVTRNLKSFKGFDGKNTFHLMLILHLIDAVNLKDVKAEVRKELAQEGEACFTQLINH